MEMNIKMRKLLTEARIQIPKRLEPLSNDLQNIAASKLVEVEGCFFLNALFPSDYDIKNALAEDDKTGIECTINNLYIQAIIYNNPYKEVVNTKLVLNQGIHYAYYLAEKIRPFGHFKIIFSYVLENESVSTVDCSVRFHLVRTGENWISGNLENYPEEAILILNT
jgi:hypothetical protein